MAQLWAFLTATQVTSESELQFVNLETGSASREMFLKALRWEISRRGVIDVLRRGMSLAHHLKSAVRRLPHRHEDRIDTFVGIGLA